MAWEVTTRRRVLRAAGGALVGGALMSGSSRQFPPSEGVPRPGFEDGEERTRFTPNHAWPSGATGEGWLTETDDVVTSFRAMGVDPDFAGNHDGIVEASPTQTSNASGEGGGLPFEIPLSPNESMIAAVVLGLLGLGGAGAWWLTRSGSDRGDAGQHGQPMDETCGCRPATDLPPSDRLTTATRTDVGRKRDHNEDSVLCTPIDPIDGWLLAVADGMGGHQAGDIASGTAIETVLAYFESEVVFETDLHDLLAGSIDAANREIRSLAKEDPAREGMGTTLVAAVVTDDGVTIANVGDSRAYLIGDGIEQVTTDQTLVRELVERGTLSEDEAENHPQRHVLTQALGTAGEINPAISKVDIGDRTLLLCSDGLTGEVSDRSIHAVVDGGSNPEAIAETLVELANENGGHDNISVVVARRS